MDGWKMKFTFGVAFFKVLLVSGSADDYNYVPLFWCETIVLFPSTFDFNIKVFSTFDVYLELFIAFDVHKGETPEIRKIHIGIKT